MYKEKIRITIIMAFASHSFPFTVIPKYLKRHSWLCLSLSYLKQLPSSHFMVSLNLSDFVFRNILHAPECLKFPLRNFKILAHHLKVYLLI